MSQIVVFITVKTLLIVDAESSSFSELAFLAMRRFTSMTDVLLTNSFVSSPSVITFILTIAFLINVSCFVAFSHAFVIWSKFECFSTVVADWSLLNGVEHASCASFRTLIAFSSCWVFEVVFSWTFINAFTMFSHCVSR